MLLPSDDEGGEGAGGGVPEEDAAALIPPSLKGGPKRGAQAAWQLRGARSSSAVLMLCSALQAAAASARPAWLLWPAAGRLHVPHAPPLPPGALLGLVARRPAGAPHELPRRRFCLGDAAPCLCAVLQALGPQRPRAPAGRRPSPLICHSLPDAPCRLHDAAAALPRRCCRPREAAGHGPLHWAARVCAGGAVRALRAARHGGRAALPAAAAGTGARGLQGLRAATGARHPGTRSRPLLPLVCGTTAHSAGQAAATWMSSLLGPEHAMPCIPACVPPGAAEPPPPRPRCRRVRPPRA